MFRAKNSPDKERDPRQRKARRVSGRFGGQRGIVAVEVAFILPVILIAVLGAVEFSRLYLVERELSAAARMGARTGVVRGSSVADVNTALATYFAGSPIANGYQVSTTGVSPTSTPDTLVTVAVDYEVSLLAGIQIPGLGGGVTFPLSASVTMRHQ